MAEPTFKEKLNSLSFPRKLGATERQPVIDERDGTIGGYHTVRWDGSQDANILAKPVAYRSVQDYTDKHEGQKHEHADHRTNKEK